MLAPAFSVLGRGDAAPLALKELASGSPERLQIAKFEERRPGLRKWPTFR